jgi:hypothetical protein
VAHCENPACTTATISTLEWGNVGYYASATIGGDGLGLIAYYDSDNRTLKIAHCSNLACTSSTISTIDNIWVSNGSQYADFAIMAGLDGVSSQ